MEPNHVKGHRQLSTPFGENWLNYWFREFGWQRLIYTVDSWLVWVPPGGSQVMHRLYTPSRGLTIEVSHLALESAFAAIKRGPQKTTRGRWEAFWRILFKWVELPPEHTYHQANARRVS